MLGNTRLLRLPMALIAALAASVGPTTMGATQAAARNEPAVYGDAVTVTTGRNADFRTPVTLDLPAHGGGVRVDHVRFTYVRQGPTYYAFDTADYVAPTPECVTDVECHVTLSVPTVRMPDEAPYSVAIDIFSEDGTLIGNTSVLLSQTNPKPSVTFTAPAAISSNQWGTVDLSVEAAESSVGVPLKGVRFYLNPTGQESDSYIFDSSPPYSARVDALDIAAAGTNGRVVAVAEDEEGNLSSLPADIPNRLRHFSIGPPPQVWWRTPGGQNRPAGGMSTGALLGWSSSIPDNVAADAYISRVEVIIDGGAQDWDMPYSVGTGWNNYQGGTKLRLAEYNHWWTTAGGLTPGPHTATVRVTTSYGSVASQDLRFTVTDGVTFGPVTSNDRVVTDGFTVPVGSTVPLTATVAGTVDNSALQYWMLSLTGSGRSLLDADNVPNACQLTDWWACPNAHTIRGTFQADAVGTYTVEFAAQTAGDKLPTTITRTINVVASPETGTGVGKGAATVRVSRAAIPAGKRVTVAGRLTRVDGGKAVAGAPMTLQWRRAGTSRWITLTTRRTDATGLVQARPLRRNTGYYRWTTPGLARQVGGARSSSAKVRVLGRR